MKLPDFFGLDIGNHTLKVAQADHKGVDKARLVAIGQMATDIGVLALDDASAREKLAQNIQQVKKIVVYPQTK